MGLVVVGLLMSAVAWNHLRGHWGTGALEVSSRSLGVLLLGCCPGGATTLVAFVSSAAAGHAAGACSGFLGEPKAHLLVVVQGRGQHEGLLQALSTSIAGVVVRYYDVVEIRKIIPPSICAERAKRQFYRLVLKVHL